MRSARTVMSSRLPIGVATTYSVPAIEWGVYCTIGGSLPPAPPSLSYGGQAAPLQLLRRGRHAGLTSSQTPLGAMPVSEPLPHFVDDLLGYLHETHPTYAA